MKKLVTMAVAVALFASSVVAANLSWNTGGSAGTPGVLSSGATVTAGSVYALLIWDVGTGVEGSIAGNGIGTPTASNHVGLDANDRVLDASSDVVANGRVRQGASARNVTWGGSAYTFLNPPTGVNATPLMPAAGTGYNLSFYIRVFNNSDITKATEYQDLNVKIGAPAIAGSPLSLAGGTLTLTGWQPVPEPATFALFGVGLAVLGLRRRFMKK